MFSRWRLHPWLFCRVFGRHSWVFLSQAQRRCHRCRRVERLAEGRWVEIHEWTRRKLAARKEL